MSSSLLSWSLVRTLALVLDIFLWISPILALVLSSIWSVTIAHMHRCQFESGHRTFRFDVKACIVSSGLHTAPLWNKGYHLTSLREMRILSPAHLKWCAKMNTERWLWTDGVGFATDCCKSCVTLYHSIIIAGGNYEAVQHDICRHPWNGNE